ncbi:alpha-N-acetylglucosaminidase [Actinoplanes sp. RD1]|uniref:alpha-N-acetylglucosaminidase n=1 Tax=Actinoplanes sp. RD1 TaxID=3064538 RepID=UPI002741F116|nr:alpha-N-acetylglucosaminidase [Actinoplanes sp. RD1]
MTPERTAHEAIQRLSALPGDRIHVTVEPTPGPDHFSVRALGDTVHVRASGAGAAIAGYSAFVRRTGVAYVGRFGTRPVRGSLPEGIAVEGTAQLAHRIAYNICVGGYTTPFFQWPQWEAELDLLAASGVTAAHLTLGQELVWLETFTRFGYPPEEILRWIAPPSHQPWMWLNNIQSFGEGTTRELIDRRAALGRRVIQRMTDLGITPILPGFSGTVPPGFADRHEHAPTVAQGKWFMDVAGPERPDWLSTTTEAYAAVARVFYAEQRRAFGAHGMWAVDLLHEGGKVGEFDIGAAARGVQAAMLAADPEATWVMQAWAGNPRRAILEAIDLGRVLVLDLTGEAFDQLGDFAGAPRVHGILPNYGGRNGLYGDLRSMAALPGRWNAAGLTDMAEGVGNNPVVWDLFGDLTWADRPVDLDAWIRTWTTARYGAADENALSAWRTLLDTAYRSWRPETTARLSDEATRALAGSPVDAGAVDRDAAVAAVLDTSGDLAAFQVYASTDSVFAAVPSTHATGASPVGPGTLGYPEDGLVPALRAMLATPATLDTPGFVHDLVDIARQVAGDVARIALRAVAAAVEAGDVASFDVRAARFLALLDGQEAVLATNRHFLLGAWTADAAAWGSSAAESAYLVRESKRLLTSWGYEDATVLAGYANRDWSGLVGDFYRSRWTIWLAELRHLLRGEPTTPVDWYQHTETWLRAGRDYGAEPYGDPRAAAAALLATVEAVLAEGVTL